MRDYVGYEMTLTNSKNEIISTDINFTTYFDKKGATDNSGVNQIENIKFTPKSSDTYTLYIRIFDVTGRSTVTSYDYKVTKPSDGDGPEFSSANIPNTGSVYTTYQLKNVGVKSPADDPLKQYVVREMTAAGKFSVMGTQFTAYTEGNYSFVDSYYKIIDGKSTLTPYNNDDANGKYTLNVSQSGTPAWQLQSRMPTVSKKDAVVELPRVIATAEYFNARVELIVKDKAGNELPIYTPDTDKEDVKPGYVKLDSTGKYSFITSVEGSYTVTYTAYYGTTNLPPQTYTIQAGDIIAPSFKLATEHDTKAVENGKFTFKEVVIEGDNGDNAVITDEELKSYRFTKTLKAPDGTIVFQVDEYGEKGRTRTIPTDKNNEPYVFDKTGPYTVEYRVYDKAGNSVPFSETITVTAAKVNNPFSTKVISTILIIVGVLLIAGVILYFVRFRKNKSSK